MALLTADVPIAAEYTRAARNVRSQTSPFVMAYYPVARLNPYQSLLYSRAWSSGVAPVATTAPTDLEALPAVHQMGVSSLVHLHWTSGVTQEAHDLWDAHTKVKRFVKSLEELRGEGVRIVWTIHNRLPHQGLFLEAEVSLRQQLTQMVDVVHIMSESTRPEVGDLYALPEDRLLVVPHPSYVGAYPMHFDRELVRFELGIDRDDFAIGLVGSIQPYKGIDELLGALSLPWCLDPSFKVIVAGPPGRDEESKILAGRVIEHPRVKAVPAKLDDQSLARLLTALDVMVLPYRDSLNSGAALLALSFGVPIVAPRIGAFKALAEQGYCLTYDPVDPCGLIGALQVAREWVAGVDYDAMRRSMALLSGDRVSQRFFDGLRKLIDT